MLEEGKPFQRIAVDPFISAAYRPMLSKAIMMGLHFMVLLFAIRQKKKQDCSGQPGQIV